MAVQAVTFVLGTHMPHWLERADVPLMVSHRRLAQRKTLPVAKTAWVLDSGGFTELHQFGTWQTTARDYAASVRRYADQIGNLRWASPQDWMCEPSARKQTKLSIAEHQRRTIANFLRLRQQLGNMVIPVLQGWEATDYLAHVDQYEQAGVTLTDEPVIGLGSVCRRNADGDIAKIIRSLLPLKLHAYGVKGTVWARLHDVLASADSMAWSAAGRRERLPTCRHKAARCQNCWTYAMRWRRQTVNATHQTKLFP